GCRRRIAADPIEEEFREANISAQSPPPVQEPRFPSPNVQPWWPRRPAQPPTQGSGETVGLIGRIRKRRTFQALRADGIRVHRGPLSMTHLDDVHDDHRRLAFAIPRRTGTAVVRNRIRRRLRAVLTDLVREDPALVPHGSILLSAGPQAADRSSADLRQDMIALFEKLRIERSTSR